MGIGLFEYAQNNPDQVEPEQARQETAATVRSFQNLEKVQELKASIADQISQGREPQYILYTAIRVIEMLTNDSEWARPLQETLDGLYSGIAQESLFRDQTAAAIRTRQEHLTRYTQKKHRELNNSLTECRKLAIELEAALRIIDNMATGTEGEILDPAEG